MAGALPLAGEQPPAGDPPPDFNQQIRPILAANCFTCHGPDDEAREAGLRLDTAEGATEDRGGYQAIQPGDAEQSELVLRITSDDPDMRMPPADSNLQLSPEQIQLLRNWIDSGADYSTHWAFVPPQRPTVPDVADAAWCAGVIDRFVLARLEAEGLRPSEQADGYSLVRRLYLDLTGLPPTPQQADAFVNDARPGAYERLVDVLLASPAYAEHWTRHWLDLARYADTNGYEKDRERSIWPYRDWVLQAIADDMPLDRFTVEQLAGDMLPEATDDQRIATGFHRNTMLNEEGGIDPLEYRYHAMVDRVATTGTVWLGLTTGCAQCHTHKYDPITHTDYYRLMALLNNADEPDLVIPVPEVQQQRTQIQRQIQDYEDQLIAQHLVPTGDGDEPVADPPLAAAFAEWVETQTASAHRWQTMRPVEMDSTMPRLTVLDDDSVLASGDVTKRDVYKLRFRLQPSQRPATALRLEVLPHESLPAGGPGMAFYEGRRGDFFLSELQITLDGRPLQLDRPSHSYGKISVGSGSADAASVIDGEGSTGWSTSGQEGQANQLVLNFAEPLTDAGSLEITLLFERHFAAALGRFRLAVTDGTAPVAASPLPAPLYDSLCELREQASPAIDALDDELLTALRRQFVRRSPELAEQRKPLDRLHQQMPDPVYTLVMRERPDDHVRPTYRHHRGEYLQAREEVQPAVPAVFPQLPDDAPADRLALARWLVSDRNPLIGRVMANRAWRAMFGTGIVHTAGDFGTQSEPPSHPQLLDYLALRLADGGWSRKRLHREIVTSATYRQSAVASEELLQRDPQNRLLARGARFRLPAESIRDAALVSSGMLARRLGGPSVHPPQPDSVTELAYGGSGWQADEGADRYRRSVYTFKKRTAPFAAYAVFDAPTGENCVARRDSSNTPLQALTLLNDAMFMELARAMADAVLQQAAGGEGDQPSAIDEDASDVASQRQIATALFRRALVRPPTDDEVDQLVQFYRDHNDSPRDGWFLVARALLNLDEFVNR